MTREENLQHIASVVEDLIINFGRRDDVMITFCKLTKERLSQFSEWDITRFALEGGNEYFIIWEPERTEIGAPLSVLYAVNVTVDSYLTAAYELLELVHRKF